MKNKIDSFIRAFTALCAITSGFLLILCIIAAYLTPSHLTVNVQDNKLISGNFPLSLRYDKKDTVYAALDSSEENNSNTTQAEIMLFGAVPVKDVTVNVTERKNVILGGTPFGIRLYTDGLIVSGTSYIKTAQGNQSPADKAGIQCGDILLSVDGQKPSTNEELLAAVEKSNGKSLQIQALHKNTEYTTEITPVYDNSKGKYRIGLMVRDSCAGIGTMTFIDPENGSFAGLGHGICDSHSGSLMPLQSGDIVTAEITSLTKSVCGTPGALSGYFSDSSSIGTISANSEQGIYGTLSQFDKTAPTIPIAFKQEVQRGNAQIITTIDETGPQYYDIIIEDISYNNINSSKNMTIRITDKKLLEKTGGIVQGMSGSPIVQNGRLVGAVTHVFVNDPSGGFAVFSENMIFANSTIIQNQVKLSA